MAEESLNIGINVTKTGVDLVEFNKRAQQEWKNSQQAMTSMMNTQKQSQDTEKKAIETKKKLTQEQNNLTKAVFTGVASWDLLKKGLSLISGTFTDLVKKGAEYQKTMLSLGIVANNFGQDISMANQSAKSLASDGLISIQTAATSLKSLLAGGLNIEQATKLITAYKDEASIGRAETISMDQAVGNLAESFLTESSMIGNLSGQTENYNNILKIGSALLGKNLSSLTAQERAMAKYLGTLEVAKKAQGGAAMMADTLQGSMDRLANRVSVLQGEFGMALAPAVQLIYEGFNDLLGQIDTTDQAMSGLSISLLKISGDFLQFIEYVKLTTKHLFEAKTAILGTIGAIAGFMVAGPLGALAGGGLAATATSLMSIKNKDAEESGAKILKIQETIQKRSAEITKNGLNSTNNLFKTKGVAGLKDYGENAKKILEDVAKLTKDYVKNVSKEMKNYSENVSKSNKDFTESLRDLVIEHKKTTRELESDISDLQKSYSENLKEMSDDYQEWLADTNKDESRRSEDYRDELKKESEAFDDRTRSIKENLSKQLANANESDETLITLAKKELAEEQKAYQDKVDEINKENQREVEDYQDSIGDKKREYEKDVENAKKTYDDKLAKLQTSLQVEYDLQKKYAQDFANFKDAQAMDDITRLKTKHDEELAEMKRAHDEKLAEMKSEYNEEVTAKGGTPTSASPTVTSSTPTTSGGGNSIVDFLRSKGKDSSFAYRSTLASKYGIGNYSGTASQNIQLLNTLRGLQSFATGGVVKGVGEVPIIAHGGEMVLNQSQIKELFSLLSNKSGGGYTNNNNLGGVNIYQNMDVDTLVSKLSFNYRTRSDIL